MGFLYSTFIFHFYHVYVMYCCVIGAVERARLDRELKLLKDIDHTNIVRLFSVYDNDENMYFVMELCQGGHLGNLLSRQTQKCVDESWARKLCRQLLSAGKMLPLALYV